MLTEQDYKEAADLVGCEIAAIKAVTKVESNGNGFLDDGRPKILFEAHIFSRLTNRMYDATYPKISSKEWNRSLYYGGAREHDRLEVACKLNREAGLKSASWGLFQIMGFNHSQCGFSTIQSFINAMYDSERQHLLAFCRFVKHKNLDQYLRNKQWAEFAFCYNGSSYALNQYDRKLEKAYNEALVK